MGKIKEIKEQRAAVYTEIAGLRKDAAERAMTAEEQDKWDKLTARHVELSDQIKREEQIAEIEARQAEQAADKTVVGDAKKEYRSAFKSYLLEGRNGLSPDAKKMLEQRAALSGLGRGAIVPTSMASQIEIALKNYGGMFEAAETIHTANGGDLFLPSVNDTASKAEIVAEYGQSKKSAPAFSNKKIGAYTYRTPLIPVSVELLQDSAYDISPILIQLLVDQFGRGTNEHLTKGTGTGQPQGIVTAATKGADAAADSITFDNILDLMSGVDAAYARNARFMFANQTLYSLMKIKDNNGQYIWQPGAGNAAPATIFGKGYVLNDDMDGIGAGAGSVLFGDLSKYKVRVVRGFQFLRLDELLAEYLSIGLYGFGRVDGTLLDAGTNPVKKLVHADS